MKWLRMIIGAGILVLAGASISVTSAGQSELCDGLSGAAFGLCTAAVNVGCDNEETRKRGCTKIEEKYEQITGGTPPWVDSSICKLTGDYCGGFADVQCGVGEFCADIDDGCNEYDGTGADCGGVCVIGSAAQCPRRATVSPLDQYFLRFEGLNGDFDNACLGDADALVGGCSGEVCAAQVVFTTCEGLPYLPDGTCICINGETQWGADTIELFP